MVCTPGQMPGNSHASCTGTRTSGPPRGWPGQPQPLAQLGVTPPVRTATGQYTLDRFCTCRLAVPRQPAPPSSSNTGTGRTDCRVVTNLQSLWLEQSFDLGALPTPFTVGLILNAFMLQELQNAPCDHARGAGTVSHRTRLVLQFL